MSKKSLALVLAAMLTAGVFVSCGGNNASTSSENSTASTSSSAASAENGESGEGSATVDTSKSVNLVYYLWGSEGVANPDILAAINEKLTADINATLEIKYIDWGDVSTKYPLLFASGEKFDMSHASPTAAISYFTLAAQGAIQDITDKLDVVPTLKEAIPENTWATSKYQGKIYGVPTLYSEFTPYGYAYRTDWASEYGFESISSVEDMENYGNALAADGKFLFQGNSADAQNLYRMFVALTPDWLNAPGIPDSQPYLVATSAENFKDIIHPAFSDEYVAWAEMMKEWSDANFWQKDILSSQVSGKDNFNNGMGAGFIAHMPDWTGNYGSVKEKLGDDVKVTAWTFGEDDGKIVRKAGVENSTVISTTSENPERALMAIEKFMTDQEYYELMQYGIKGRQYEVVDGVAVKPDTFDQDKDGGGFSAWALRNDAFNIPYATEDPVRYELIEEWKENAIDNPFAGFSFDDTNVKTQLANISNVNNQIGVQLMLGKAPGDVAAAVEDYRNQLTSAGIEDVINELKSQLEGFTPLGK